MIFDEPIPRPDSGPPRRRVRRRRAGGSSREDGRRSSSRRGGGTFEKAVRLQEPIRDADSRDNTAWLWVLGILIVAAVGFAFYLHSVRSVPYRLPGEAPTTRLAPFVDPILAPLAVGAAGYDTEALDALASQFRRERENAPKGDAAVFSAAVSITESLREALVDRDRHLQRLMDIGPEHSETERKHLELAVDVSWQRNSTAYRNGIERAWMRLQQLEQGRFRPVRNADNL